MPRCVRAADERFAVQPAFALCCLIDVTLLRAPRTTRLAAAFVAAVLTGCGVAGPEPRTFIGPVTVVRHNGVCIGGPDASGECFVKDQMTKDLHVSDCIRVTYTPDESAAYATPTKIEQLDAGSHTSDCPRQ
jgi:hypothetical protein